MSKITNGSFKTRETCVTTSRDAVSRRSNASCLVSPTGSYSRRPVLDVDKGFVRAHFGTELSDSSYCNSFRKRAVVDGPVAVVVVAAAVVVVVAVQFVR